MCRGNILGGVYPGGGLEPKYPGLRLRSSISLTDSGSAALCGHSTC